MISKISKLKNFGIFHDFSWKAELPEFKKFNLIYGWNRSGKTTISRVLASCEKKCVYDKDKFKQCPENGEFEIKTSDGTTVKNTDVAANTLPIKVFNQDFINDNISFDPLKSCDPIVYVSEEDIESKKQLEKLKVDKIIFAKNYEDAKKNKIAKEEIKTVFLKGLGITISNIIFDKTYNRTKAENKINEIGVDNFLDRKLSDGDNKRYEKIKNPVEVLGFMKTEMGYKKDMEKWSAIHNTFKFFKLGRPLQLGVIRKNKIMQNATILLDRVKSICKKEKLEPPALENFSWEDIEKKLIHFLNFQNKKGKKPT